MEGRVTIETLADNLHNAIAEMREAMEDRTRPMEERQCCAASLRLAVKGIIQYRGERDEQGRKYCRACMEWKDPDAFYMRPVRKETRRVSLWTYCKDCTIKRNVQWQKDNDYYEKTKARRIKQDATKTTT